jgi:hypothetical protein
MNIEAKFDFFDKQDNDSVVHCLQFGKANDFSCQPLDPRPDVQIFASDFPSVALAKHIDQADVGQRRTRAIAGWICRRQTTIVRPIRLLHRR